jgi:glycine cleavage system regulatory protein
MPRFLVMTVIGPDRPGLVEELSKTIATHGGSWLESRMANLAGHFTGLLRVECPDDRHEELLSSLQGLTNLTIHVAEELAGLDGNKKTLRFDVVANDRPGIVQQLASAIARTGGNVEDLTSSLESAPHAGHPVFRATGSVTVPADFEYVTLFAALEGLSPDLSVSVE